MPGKPYLLIGQFQGGYSGPLGVRSYRFDPMTGELAERGTYAESIAAGALCVDAARELVYACDERPHLPGRLGGGSFVHTFHLDRKTGALESIGRIGTLSPSPCGLALTRDRRWLLVCHNSDAGHVTKLVSDGAGSFRAETVFDDAALVLLALDARGIPERVADVLVIRPGG